MATDGPSPRRGFAPAFFGAVLGALVLGGSVAGLAFLIPCEDDGFECLGVAILALLGAALGAAIGAIAGCYIALRVRRHAAAGRTAWVLLALLVATSLFTGLLAGVTLGEPAGMVIVVAVYGALPLAARALALRNVPDPQVSGGVVDI